MRFAAGAGRKMIQLNKWTTPLLSRRGHERAGERWLGVGDLMSDVGLVNE